ncbi:MAG TPA: ribose-phosphate pyrophosphokinase [Bacillota bacterium]|jgi:ribose-phosphate pyrophosphokinase
MNLQVLTGSANRALAEEIAGRLGIRVGKADVGRFSDGEIKIIVEENVRGADVFLVQPTCTPINDNLMELLIMIDAVRRASAQRVTAVIPYYGYARQDRKTRGREPITAKLVANLLTTAGVGRILAVDLHAGQIQGFFDIPVDHLSGIPIIAEYLLSKKLNNAVVVSPDLGGVTRARTLADRLGVPIAIIDKRRPEPNAVEVMNVIGKVQGKTVIMVDDIIDTAGTICLGAAAMVERGATEVYACATHPVLSGPAVERLESSPIKEVVVTNTIPLTPEEASSPKFKVLSIGTLLAEAISRIAQDLSISTMFK